MPDKSNKFIEAVRFALRVIENNPPDARTATMVLSRLDKSHDVQVRVWHSKERAHELRDDEFPQLRSTLLMELRESLYAYRYPRILDIVEGAVIRYDAIRRQAGLLNHNDLLLITRDMLRRHTALRRLLQEHFTHFLVDEFQDTDPLQSEILLFLTTDEDADTDWNNRRIRPGSLFVVGDPRQSIYRFRRADIRIYNRMRQIIESSGGRVLYLSASFRAVPALCGWINAVFDEHVFGTQATDQQPAAAALQATRHDSSGLCGAYALPVTDSAADQEIKSILDSEAACIASWIHDACAAGVQIPNPSGGSDETRALLPSDILLLVREHHDVMPLARALEERSIPTIISGGRGLSETTELKHVLNALRALTDPENPIPIVAFLRGPFCGADDRALLAYKRAGGLFAFNARAIPDMDPRIAEGLKFIKDTVRLVRSNPPATVVASMLERLTLQAVVAAAPSGWLRAGAVQSLMNIVQHDSAAGASIPEIVTRVEAILEEGKVSGMQLDTVSNGVRIMTLHSAKGLEAPVVILASGKGVRSPFADIVIDRHSEKVRGAMSFRRSSGPFRSEVIAQPKDWKESSEEEHLFLAAEQQRLAYVAATRASSALVVSFPTTTGRDRSPTWKMFSESVLLPLPDLQPKPAAIIVESEIPDVLQIETVLSSLHQGLRRTTYARMQPSSLTSVVRNKNEAGDGSGRAFGSAMHRLLESVARHTVKNAREFSEELAHEEGLPEEAVDEMLNLLTRVQSHSLWQRMQSTDQLFLELPFAHQCTEEGLPAVMRGTMDVVFRDSEGWTIVDYKTDAIHESIEEHAERYAAQMEAYRNAWQQITGERARGLLWYLQPNIVLG